MKAKRLMAVVLALVMLLSVPGFAFTDGDEASAVEQNGIETEALIATEPAAESEEETASEPEAAPTEAEAIEDASVEPESLPVLDAEEKAVPDADAPEEAEVADADAPEDAQEEAPASEADVPLDEKEPEPEKTSGYVLMNIPYSAFYAAEGTSDVDAVSSATRNKPRTIGLAGGSYHVNSDGSDITGVIYPVYVADMSVLSDYTEITDESSVTITVTNRGTTTETTFTGKDALFEAPSYAYYVLSETPAIYKTWNGSGSFSAVNAKAATVTGVTGDVTVGGRHANIEIKLSGTEGIDSSTRVSGIVLTDSDGNKYGLRHVSNIWRGTEIGWNFGEYDLSGKTIKNIRYYTQSAVIDYPVSITVDEAIYATMNIPYADFYSQIVGDANGSDIDAFTSATTKKAAYFWDSSYKGNNPVAYGEGQTIKGVQFPVLITKADASKLASLGAADTYACKELDSAPALYVKATVNEDGTVSFAKLSARATVLTDATATITNDTKHGDYMITIADDGGVLTEADKATFQVYGAVLATAEGTYPVRHLANLYYKDFNQIGLFTTAEESAKGQKDSAYEFYASLEGQTITSITLYTNSGVYQVNTDLFVGSTAKSGYVLMNIPYSEFYAAEGTSDVDAVSSATLNKPRTIGLAGGSYHVNSDGSDITGVIYPVYVADMSVLSDYTEITDESSVTITVTNRGTTTETTFTGKDALFEAPSYAYYVLSEAPAIYKTLNEDGSFSAVNAEAQTVNGVTADITYAAKHANIEVSLSGTEGIDSSTRVSGIVLTDSDGNIYGLRHVGNIWRAIELGWNDDEIDLYGKTLTNIRYITQDAVIDYPVEITFKLRGTEISGSFESGTSIAVTGLPTDIVNAKVTVSSVVGRGETPVVLAENVEIRDGVITLTDAAVDGTTYNIVVVSDNYADLTTQAVYTAEEDQTQVDVQTKLVISDEPVLTEDLEAAGKTVASIKDELRSAVIQGKTGYTAANVKILDAELLISEDGGETWNPASAEYLPATIILPYPDEAKDPSQFEYRVAHMIASGADAGKIEILEAEETEDGLKVTVNSFSPFAIAWKSTAAQKDPTPTPSATTKPSSGNRTGTKSASGPRTGDELGMTILPYTVLSMVCAAALICLVIISRKSRGSRK